MFKIFLEKKSKNVKENLEKIKNILKKIRTKFDKILRKEFWTTVLVRNFSLELGVPTVFKQLVNLVPYLILMCWSIFNVGVFEFLRVKPNFVIS